MTNCVALWGKHCHIIYIIAEWLCVNDVGIKFADMLYQLVQCNFTLGATNNLSEQVAARVLLLLS